MTDDMNRKQGNTTVVPPTPDELAVLRRFAVGTSLSEVSHVLFRYGGWTLLRDDVITGQCDWIMRLPGAPQPDRMAEMAAQKAIAGRQYELHAAQAERDEWKRRAEAAEELLRDAIAAARYHPSHATPFAVWLTLERAADHLAALDVGDEKSSG